MSRPAVVGFVLALTALLLIVVLIVASDGWSAGAVQAMLLPIVGTFVLAIICAPIGWSQIGASQGTRYGKSLVVATWIVVALCVVAGVIGAFIVVTQSIPGPGSG